MATNGVDVYITLWRCSYEIIIVLQAKAHDHAAGPNEVTLFKSLQSPQSFQCMAQRFCTNIHIARGGKYKYFVTVLKHNVLGICNLLKIIK